jgi:hypothetical protein
MIRAAGRDGVARSVVFASFARLAELRAELHAVGVAEATATSFHLPPSIDQTIENQIALLNHWLAAQFSSSNPLAAPVLARFLPVPSYLALVHATPSPSPPWVSDGWIRRGVRARPTRLQAAQRRLAFAMLELAPDDADAEAGEPTWLTSSLILDLLCNDVQEQVGKAMGGLDYPQNQPTPEALIEVIHRRATAMKQARSSQQRAQRWLISELKRLIDASVDVDGNNEFMETPLKAAAAAGDSAAIHLLLDAKASVDECGQSYSQRTPLMMAANGTHESAVEVLLERGADDTLVDTDGRSVADIVLAQPGKFSKKMHALVGLY